MLHERVFDLLDEHVYAAAMAEQQELLQAEAARHRKLARALGSLGVVELVPPSGLADDVLLALDEADHASVLEHLRHHRAAYLGGLAAGVASVAGVAGAIVLARSRRSPGRVA